MQPERGAQPVEAERPMARVAGTVTFDARKPASRRQCSRLAAEMSIWSSKSRMPSPMAAVLSQPKLLVS